MEDERKLGGEPRLPGWQLAQRPPTSESILDLPFQRAECSWMSEPRQDQRKKHSSNSREIINNRPLSLGLVCYVAIINWYRRTLPSNPRLVLILETTELHFFITKLYWKLWLENLNEGWHWQAWVQKSSFHQCINLFILSSSICRVLTEPGTGEREHWLSLDKGQDRIISKQPWCRETDTKKGMYRMQYLGQRAMVGGSQKWYLPWVRCFERLTLQTETEGGKAQKYLCEVWAGRWWALSSLVTGGLDLVWPLPFMDLVLPVHSVLPSPRES